MCILASGVVIYRPAERSLLFLLLENASHGTWGFPKGHVNAGEGLEAAAARECEEETGITPSSFHADFKKTVEYEYPEKGSGRLLRKKTVYFLSARGGEDVRLSAEHKRFFWEPRLEARARLQYDTLRELLDCAFAAAANKQGLPHGDVPAARALLDEVSDPEDVWHRHSLKVAEMARKIAEGILLRRPDLPLEIDFIEAAALVHDIGRSRDHGIEHPRLGMELLFEKGLGHLAKTCISHWLKGRKRGSLEKNPYFTPSRIDGFYKIFDLDTLTLSEKIISLADSLVQHDRPVRLEERYRDARKRYGDSKWMRDNEAISSRFVEEIQAYLGLPLYEYLQM